MNVSVNISLIPAVFLNVKSLTVFFFFSLLLEGSCLQQPILVDDQ